MSYIAMEENVCPICGTCFCTDSIVVDMTLNEDRFPDKCVTTGYGYCKECDAKVSNGYVALIGVCNRGENTHLQMNEADRLKKYACKKN